MDQAMHRRSFVKRAGLLAGTAWLVANPEGRADAPAVRIRPEINTLDPNGPEVATLKKAVAELERRSRANMADPTGWVAQARIHFDHCPHNNWFFLPWHRAYLYFFEQICRDASGDPNFLLPYWDWSKNPTLPAVFWGGASNPLDHPKVNPDFPGPYQGREITPSEPIDPEFNGPDVIAMIRQNGNFFYSVGGQPAAAPRSSQPGPGMLEGTPHNNVHGQILGDMGDYWSPLDPIFWLHHANVDRIWALWTDDYPGNFPNDATYLGFSLSDFFDTSGNPARLTVTQTRSTFDLGYRYPDQKASPPTLAVNTPVPHSAEQRVTSQVTGSADRTRPLLVPIAQPKDSPFSKALALLAQPRPQNLVEGGTRLLMEINGIGKQLPSGAFVRTFINCPYLKPDTPRTDPHYVGSFAFFSHGEGGHGGDAGHGAAKPSGLSLVFDATEAVARLGPQLDPSQLLVGLVVQARPGSGLADQSLELKPSQVGLSLIGARTLVKLS
jgi:hypothetical protein